MKITSNSQWHSTVLVAALGLSMASTITAQKAIADHPLVSRFQGSEVQDYKQVEFDEFKVPLGPITGTGASWTKVQSVEGKVTKFRYTIPQNRSTLEVYRTYQNELQRAGFQMLYGCGGKECTENFGPNRANTEAGTWCWDCGEPMRFLAAKLARPSGDVYVTVTVDNYNRATWLNIVEVKPLGGGLVTVNAPALAKAIAQTGHTAVYGIYFDTGKADIKPESDTTLAEISKLLASSGQMKLHVVGHTDNVGAFASNMTLSKQRADAVVIALTSHYHVSANRLQASGAGPLAPVASNQGENGRSRNRRVELVEQ